LKSSDLLGLISEGFFILDGAMGTNLHDAGMPAGACPEKWAMENPDAVIGLQQEYLDAGSSAVYTFTLGANRFKLRHYGLARQAASINESLARLSRQAAGRSFVGGCIGSLGEFIQPNGPIPFEEAYQAFRDQAAALALGGADYIIIETISDIQEARAAVLAAREACSLPVFACLTFDGSGRTLMGTDPVSALNILQSLGADAVGCNCSTGPQEMAVVIELMKPHARVPLIAKPNAGLPRVEKRRVVFDMGPEEFARDCRSLVDAGATLLGGCCGTRPAHIRALSAMLKKIRPEKPAQRLRSLALSSMQDTVFIGKGYPVAVIGERINPTGKPVLQQALLHDRLEEVLAMAAEQEHAGADILDVNVGMPGLDEAAILERCALVLSRQPLPLCFDSASPEALEKALRVYPGRALVNSIPADPAAMERLLPVARQYGAAFILLPMGAHGVSKTSAGRIEVVKAAAQKALDAGFTADDMLVDGLTMAVSADAQAPRETLRTVGWCGKNGFYTVLGISNVSFGLPQREHVNAAFLAQAAARGLCAAIVNPQSRLVMDQKAASDVLCGRDQAAKRYISRFNAAPAAAGVQDSRQVSLYDAVLRGQSRAAKEAAHQALVEGSTAEDLIGRMVIPALEEVGRRFERKEFFLPQLMLSAESAKAAFSLISPHLKDGEKHRRCTVVMATVKGDIHDIGKNIVGLMLGNHGFNVVDLGKDVPAEQIIAAAKEKHAKIIGLSALITTTMPQMQRVADMIRDQRLVFRLMVGGAVVTQEYADRIGADGYAGDAAQAVQVAKELEAMP
jgi:5-methyltetrahydrofolate--homocysteine methyltransferase